MEENELSLERVLAAVLRRKRAFLASFAAAAATLGTAAAQIPPRYKASVVLTIEPGRYPNDFLRPNVIPDLETRLSGMEKMLESAPVIEELRTRTGLAARDGRHGVLDALGITALVGGDPIESWRKSFEFEVVASQTPQVRRPDEAVVVEMSFKNADPELAARVVNACAARANEENTRFRRAWVEEVVRFVQKEEERVKDVVREREDALNGFKLSNADRLPEQEPYVVARLGQLRVRYADLKNAERFGDSRLEQLTSERGLLVAQIALAVQIAQGGGADSSAPGDLRTERVRLLVERDAREDELITLEKQLTPRAPQVQIARDRLEATKKRLAETESRLAGLGVSLAPAEAPRFAHKDIFTDDDGKAPGNMPGGLPKVPVRRAGKDKDDPEGKDAKPAPTPSPAAAPPRDAPPPDPSAEPPGTRVCQVLSGSPLVESALEKSLDSLSYRLVVANPGYARIRTIDFALKETKEALAETAHQREDSFSEIRKSEEVLAAIPGVRQRLEALLRSLLESRDDWNRLQNQLDNARKALAVENEGKGEQLRVIDFARPPSRPSGPPAVVFMGIAVALAVAMAAGLCLVLDLRKPAPPFAPAPAPPPAPPFAPSPGPTS